MPTELKISEPAGEEGPRPEIVASAGAGEVGRADGGPAAAAAPPAAAAAPSAKPSGDREPPGGEPASKKRKVEEAAGVEHPTNSGGGPGEKKPNIDDGAAAAAAASAEDEKNGLSSASALEGATNNMPRSDDAVEEKGRAEDLRVDQPEKDGARRHDSQGVEWPEFGSRFKGNNPQSVGVGSADNSEKVDESGAASNKHSENGRPQGTDSDAKDPESHAEGDAEGDAEGNEAEGAEAHLKPFEVDPEKVRILQMFKQCKVEGCEEKKMPNCEGYCRTCHEAIQEHVPAAGESVAKAVARAMAKVKATQVAKRSTPKAAKAKATPAAKRSTPKAAKAKATPAAKRSTPKAAKAKATPAAKRSTPKAATAKATPAAKKSTLKAAKAKATPAAKKSTPKAAKAKETPAVKRSTPKPAKRAAGKKEEWERTFADRLSVPLPTEKEQRQPKPILKAGTSVYAAYWPPEDVGRKTNPNWYPGVVTSYRVSKVADKKYGKVRDYNIDYDDGDRLTLIPDHFVMAAEDYELNLRHDEENEGKRKFSWRGVRNVLDRKSEDHWAKCVGWYETTIEGETYAFSNLSGALRAHDASVVRANGPRTKESELNLPEEWEGLFEAEEIAGKGGKGTGPGKVSGYQAAKAEKAKRIKAAKAAETKGNKAAKAEKTKWKKTVKVEEPKGSKAPKGAKASGGKASGGKPNIKHTSAPPAGHVVSVPWPSIGPRWTRESLLAPNGITFVEYVSPLGTRFKTVELAKKFWNGYNGGQAKKEGAEGAKGKETRPPLQAAAPASLLAAQNNKKWTTDETMLIIQLDEQYGGYKLGEKYSRMAERLPRFEAKGCGAKIQKLRKEVADGKDLASLLGLLDIKTTLSKWTKAQIDKLIALEERHRDEDEEAKNARIARLIPRWDADQCSFKTLYMRWETRVREEAAAQRRRKEAAKRKRKTEAEVKAGLVGKVSLAAGTPPVKKQKTAPPQAGPMEGPARKGEEPAARNGDAAGSDGATMVTLPPTAPMAMKEDASAAGGKADVSGHVASSAGTPTAKKQETAQPQAGPMEGVARKGEEPAARKGDSADSDGATVVTLPPAATKEDASALAGKAGVVGKVAPGAGTPPAKNQKTAPPHAGPPSETKIDDNFVEMLNNDPYLLGQCGPQTIEGLTGKKLRSEES